MVLSTEWSQVEVIDLVNDGSGLGFGIVGGRSTGVVIKSILPGGIADKDNRLQSGDHILQIGDVQLRGLGSEQVASVLRQAGAQVRMVVARPVEPSSADFQNFGSTAPVVPTKILTDTEELNRHLLQNGYAEVCNYLEETQIEINGIDLNLIDQTELYTEEIQVEEEEDVLETLPETERLTIELNRNEYGLGITIAGYVCEREDLCGIFVKSLNEGSEAFKCGKININDRIVEVDGQSLQNVSNYEAVEKLKQTGTVVQLTFERYLRGPKFEQLQEALACQESKDLSPPSPSVTTLSWIPIDTEVI